MGRDAARWSTLNAPLRASGSRWRRRELGARPRRRSDAVSDAGGLLAAGFVAGRRSRREGTGRTRRAMAVEGAARSEAANQLARARRSLRDRVPRFPVRHPRAAAARRLSARNCPRSSRASGAAGALNSLQQTLLRLTSPGIPDLYQGTELWDFSLVDPDNRRPVDFGSAGVACGGEAKGPPSEQLPNWRDGRVKLAVVQRVLALRQHAASLFAQGEYLPLTVQGKHADRVIAFARHGQRVGDGGGDAARGPLLDEDGDTAARRCGAVGRHGGGPAGRADSRALFDWLSPAAPKVDGERLICAMRWRRCRWRCWWRKG